MKFIGQFIQSFIARFRNDVYLENISSGTIASGGNLGLDSNNKIVKASEATGDITGVTLAGDSGSASDTSANVDLITMASELVEPKDSVAAKIYIRNIGYRGVIDKSVGVTIGVNSEPIGKLYGGDWMMMPLTCIDADDITATPENDNTVVLEYMMFYEEA